MFMFKVILQLNEEQVKKDKEFNLSDIYKEIDNLYKETGCYLLEKENYLANNTYNEWVYDDMLKDWRETFYAD